jgi:hypothetical protein
MTETAGEIRSRRRLGWYLLAVAAIPLALLVTLQTPNAASPLADSPVFSTAQRGSSLLFGQVPHGSILPRTS